MLMDMLSIDWNEICRERQLKTSFPRGDFKFWDRRAHEFTRHATSSDYIGQFLQIMNPEPSWSVLDVGCAAGTLAVPLAGRVNRITAVDPSDVMLTLLGERCRQGGIDNIRAVKGSWEDDWDGLGLGVHDVAIASRSLLVPDLRQAILKLDAHARKRVYIATIVGDGPHDRKIVRAAGRSFHPGADYIYVVNLLYQMGIRANVTFTIQQEDKSFADVPEALDSIRWMVEGMSPEEEGRLREFLAGYLVPEGKSWKLPDRRPVRWAVLWWEKEPA